METRYAFVARKLTEDIVSGRSPVGSNLPTEVQLAEQYEVSRSTVRAALGQLQQLGLVSRKRKTGTRVESSMAMDNAPGYTHSIETVDDLLQYASATKRQVQEVTEEVADDQLAQRLGCRPGRRWLRVSSIRVDIKNLGSPPICWTDVYVDGVFKKLIEKQIFKYSKAISSLLEERAGRRIAEVVQTLRAIPMPENLAEPLQTIAHAPALEIKRRYIESNSNVLLVSINVHKSDEFAYTMRLRRKECSDS